MRDKHIRSLRSSCRSLFDRGEPVNRHFAHPGSSPAPRECTTSPEPEKVRGSWRWTRTIGSAPERGRRRPRAGATGPRRCSSR
ncbi:uncharacterized protein LOC100277390 [Zea mays]|uniref:uncharacterized protein LOC100277390 n=1 Tax=Zea mays TaxID=4577 RepID=UPI000220ABFF|nr:uncharacterized protein LOC100277390 [Zea mays]